MESNYLSVLQRLKEERERRNLTQRLLCYYMKIQQSHFSRAETGQRRFSYHELKGLCTTDVDVLYVFTGRKTNNRRKFSEKADFRPEELICLLNTLYTLTSAAWFINRKKAAFEHIHEQLEYIRCGNGHFTEKSNVFHYARDSHGYTQKEMADMLGVDIKKLRELEKGRILPDSEIIWKMYDLFQISPAFILKDPKGLQNELNCTLDLLEDDDQEIILQILENEYKLIQCC